MNGAEALIKVLETRGVEYVFGYSGGAAIPIFDALITSKTKIKLILTVLNQPGVLVRVAHTFARRGVNIKSLHVEPIGGSEWSEMIIDMDKTEQIKQIIQQLEKLVDVKEVKTLNENRPN